MLDKLITEKTLENLAGAGSFQRGNAYFSAGSVGPLRDTGKKVSARVDLVAAYLQRRRNDEAMHLTWLQFEERPSLTQYKKLHAVAEQLGIWPEQRERALARVAEVIADQALSPCPGSRNLHHSIILCGLKSLCGRMISMPLGQRYMRATAIKGC